MGLLFIIYDDDCELIIILMHMYDIFYGKYICNYVHAKVKVKIDIILNYDN